MAITCAAKPRCHAAHMSATLRTHAAVLLTLLLGNSLIVGASLLRISLGAGQPDWAMQAGGLLRSLPDQITRRRTCSRQRGSTA